MKHKLLLLLATGFGVGYIPLASGTFGSIVAFPFFLWIYCKWNWGLQTIVCTIGFFMSVSIATYAENVFNEKDSGKIVIDEILGMWVTFIGIPLTLPTAIAGFLFFRLFDIWKFNPMDRLQALSGGWGIVADDVVAGIFANILLHIFTKVF